MLMQSLYSIVLAIKYRATRMATLAGVGIAFTKFKNVFILFPFGLIAPRRGLCLIRMMGLCILPFFR